MVGRDLLKDLQQASIKQHVLENGPYRPQRQSAAIGLRRAAATVATCAPARFEPRVACETSRKLNGDIAGRFGDGAVTLCSANTPSPQKGPNSARSPKREPQGAFGR
jgi:hypothetical protein